jgi:hypothetical protein
MPGRIPEALHARGVAGKRPLRAVSPAMAY